MKEKLCRKCKTKLEPLKGTGLWHCSVCEEATSDFIERADMIHATLQRTSSDDTGTFGVLRITDRDIICFTLEPPWRDNQEDISCIPAGTYIVKRHHSKRFGEVWELQDVEGRTRIYIHRGNIVRHTKGCILVGLMKGDLRSVPAVLDSRGAWEKLNRLFGDDDFELTITEGI